MFSTEKPAIIFIIQRPQIIKTVDLQQLHAVYVYLLAAFYNDFCVVCRTKTNRHNLKMSVDSYVAVHNTWNLNVNELSEFH